MILSYISDILNNDKTLQMGYLSLCDDHDSVLKAECSITDNCYKNHMLETDENCRHRRVFGI